MISAAVIEAGLLPATTAGTAVTTPELDYHKQRQEEDEEDDDVDDDEIVLTPALAGLALR